MQVGLFLSNNVNYFVALPSTTTHYQSFIADEDEALYSNLLPGKILFGQVKAVFQCQTKDHKAAVAENVCLGRNSASFYNRVTNSPLV